MEAAIGTAEVGSGSRPSATQGVRAFSAALNAGDLEAAMACFAWGATLATPDATLVRGEASIRAILSQVIERGIEITVERSVVRAEGGVATVSEDWTIKTPGPGGAGHLVHSSPLFALRPDSSSWKLVAAAPWRSLAARPRS